MILALPLPSLLPCSAHSFSKLTLLCSHLSPVCPQGPSDTGDHGFPFSRPSQLTCYSARTFLQ